MRSFGVAVMLAVFTLVGCAGQTPAPSSSVPLDPAEKAAITQVFEDSAKAFNQRDLNGTLSHIAEDARIDSAAAGRKVSKTEYTEVMRKVYTSPPPDFPSTTEYRLANISMSDAMHATVDGDVVLRWGASQSRTAGARWLLEKRGGRWLIVNSDYKTRFR